MLGDDLDQQALRARIAELRLMHRSLDDEVKALSVNGVADQLKLARLKKEKLRLKDEIAILEDQLTPDIIA
ncbi:MAG: DUF465 domain-containing protein [Maricaulaceae bacterium]|nr:DUF465 domain-containing protein [Maricaulaceae bacterium]